MKIFWLVGLMLLVMPLFAWAGEYSKHGDGCGCAKAHHDCKCAPIGSERCTEIAAPGHEVPSLDPNCCPHSEYRLLCPPCACGYKSCCGHEEFRLLCCAKAKPTCGPSCKVKCNTIRHEITDNGGIEF